MNAANKKNKKIVNKFKKLIYASKIVNLCIKNVPKPPPKPKKKKFLKLKLINSIINITIKSKISYKKFKAQKIKSSSMGRFKIESTITKIKIILFLIKIMLNLLLLKKVIIIKILLFKKSK